MKQLLDNFKYWDVRLIALALFISLVAQPALAQKNNKIFLIKGRNITPYNLAVAGFRTQAPTDWNIFEYDMSSKLQHIDNMINRLEREKPDLVVAVGAKALSTLIHAEVSYPTVFCMVMNPAAYDLRPFDITGVSLATAVEKQMRVLMSLCPKVKKIGVMLRQETSQNLLKKAINLSQIYGVKIIPVELKNEKEIPRKLRPALSRIDVLWMLDDSYIHSKDTLEFVVLSSLENRIPFMANSEVFVKEGALVSLTPSFFDNGRQAADLAYEILVHKKRPKNIPISLHKNPKLIINLKVAKRINLTIPPGLLDKAGRIYE